MQMRRYLISLVGVLALLLLLVQSGFATTILPDRCVTMNGYVCEEFLVQWGTNGTDGEFRLVLRNVADKELLVSRIVVRTDDWSCTLPSEDAGLWEDGAQRAFVAHDCDFLTLDTHRFKAALYADDAWIGEIVARIEGSPGYPRKTFMREFNPWLYGALAFLIL